jgi:hypothetical protein
LSGGAAIPIGFLEKRFGKIDRANGLLFFRALRLLRRIEIDIRIYSSYFFFHTAATASIINISAPLSRFEWQSLPRIQQDLLGSWKTLPEWSNSADAHRMVGGQILPIATRGSQANFAGSLLGFVGKLCRSPTKDDDKLC